MRRVLVPGLLALCLLQAPLPAAAETAASATSSAAAAATPAPGAPDPGPRLGPVLVVTPKNVTADPVTGRLALSPDALPAPATGLPVLDPEDQSPAAKLLRHLLARGRAAGLAGVLYDNHDRGHSRLDPRMFPALTRIAYGAEFRRNSLDFGPAGAFRFPAITFGNSSTAITGGPAPRSMERLLMTSPGGAWGAWDDYVSNTLYVYPEHHDHDAVDFYPANWPYTLSSQGSSGSDRIFLRAIAMILAAFQPETRARLQAEGLVMPTLQMVFRRAQTGVRSDADYMSGPAQPTVFSKGAVALPAMISFANSLSPDAIPPVVRLSVEREDFSGRAGLLGGSEKLFDTPSAIARLWRGPAWQHRMEVSAAQTTDPNGRPLRFHWVLLRGDPERVRLMPLDERGLRARIVIDWQTPRPAPAGFAAAPPGAPGPMSDRVDIGVFADNGAQLSAPAFISIDFPGQQLRRYEPVPGAAPADRMRLAEIDYDAKRRGVPYDPLLWWSAPWRDLYHYDAAGRLTGWTRLSTRPGGPPAQAFAADGAPLDGPRAGSEAPLRYQLKRPGADLRPVPP